jgi:hypothetical protein
MTTDRRRRSTATQLKLPLQSHPSEVAKAAQALKAVKAARAGGAGKAGGASKASPGARSIPEAPRHPGDWRLDEQTRRIGRQGVAAARALLGDTTDSRHPEGAERERRKPGRAA